MSKLRMIGVVGLTALVVVGGGTLLATAVPDREGDVPPPLPASPVSHGIELLYAQPYLLDEPYTHWWRAEQPQVRAGYLLVLAVVCVGAWVAVVRMALPGPSLPASAGVGLLLALAYLIVGLLLTRRTLGCKWRSVLTVLVMTTFLADVIMLCLWLLLGMLIPALGAAALLPNLV